MGLKLSRAAESRSRGAQVDQLFSAFPRFRGFVVIASAFSLLASNAFAQFPPDGPGKDTFESVCSLCHAPTAVAGKLWTRPQWEAKVIEMLQEEPDVTAQERSAIVEYLSSHFKPGGKIYINVVNAKDLAAALQLAPEDAEAVVLYRKEKGSFSTADELKKVPRLDFAKVEAERNRLDFSKAR